MDQFSTPSCHYSPLRSTQPPTPQKQCLFSFNPFLYKWAAVCPPFSCDPVRICNYYSNQFVKAFLGICPFYPAVHPRATLHSDPETEMMGDQLSVDLGEVGTAGFHILG
jgi:hypothetical protein